MEEQNLENMAVSMHHPESESSGIAANEEEEDPNVLDTRVPVDDTPTELDQAGNKDADPEYSSNIPEDSNDIPEAPNTFDAEDGHGPSESDRGDATSGIQRVEETRQDRDTIPEICNPSDTNQNESSTNEESNSVQNEDTTEAIEKDADSPGRMLSMDSEWTLLSLPRELLLRIFDFLDARFVIREVSSVCKMLHDIVSDNLEWKVRFKKRFPGTYPIVPVEDDDFNWTLACIEREETHHRWAGHESNMEHFSLSMAHIAAIDCVHLMNNGELCATGSRDRTYQMWDLRKLDANNPEKSVKDARAKDVKAHKGWVWDITSLDHHMCTASWDCWLKLWDINDDMKCVQKFKGRSAFLSVVYQHDVIVAGAYDKSIYHFDPRVNDQNSLIDQKVYHARPVLTVQADDHYIISGSEDKTIAIFERRADSVLKKLTMDSFCMCMSYQHGQIWTGHRDGNVNVIDPTHGSFDVVQTYDVGHKGKITDIMYTMGALYTCSTDATIRISDPNHNPETMCKLTSHTRDLTALDLQCGVLASASSDLTAGIWRPKQDNVVEEFESY